MVEESQNFKASEICRNVFFDCFTCFPNMLKILDVSNDTTAAGAGLWHERPSATGNGSRRMFVDVGGQATHWGCLEQQRTIC